mgnify:CR=1 FL=1
MTTIAGQRSDQPTPDAGPGTRWWPRIWPPIASIGVALALWWAATSMLCAPQSLLRQTAPQHVLRALTDLAGRGVLVSDATVSLYRLLIGLLIAALVGYQLYKKMTTNTVVAYFSEALALYPGDRVQIMGVKVGNIDKIEPAGDKMKVTFHYANKYKVPADATATILNPSLVASRVIQLAPAYTGGPVLDDNAVIPIERTQVPVEWDDLRNQISELVTTLGPTKDQPKGPFGDALESFANGLEGKGEQINKTFRALSDATRRIILDELAQRDGQSLFEICSRLAMRHGIGSSRQAISQHLAVLEAAGLVTTEKVGRVRTCRIGTGRLDEVAAWIGSYQQRWDARFDELDTVVAQLRQEEERDGRAEH